MDPSAYSSAWRLSNNTESPYVPAYGDVPIRNVGGQTPAYMYGNSHRQSTISSNESHNRFPPTFQREKLSWSAVGRHILNEDLIKNPINSNYGNNLNLKSLGISSKPPHNPSSLLPRPILARVQFKSAANGCSESLSATSPRKPLGPSNYQHEHSIHPNCSPNERRTSTSRRALDFGSLENDLNNSSATPSNIPRRRAFDKVSLEIWKYFESNRQTVDFFHKKIKFKEDIHTVLRKVFPDCDLIIVGSSVSGLGTKTSDLDLCVALSPHEIEQQVVAMQFLKIAQDELKNCTFVKSMQLIAAKVPILKFTDENEDVTVELNINNMVGVSNTKLITKYCQLDWRVQPLVLAIKKWAQAWNINNAKDTTLSSYSLVLMTIHYLQCGCEPPVLPCLQNTNFKKLLPKKSADSHDLRPLKMRNIETLSQLLLGFYYYFCCDFNFDTDVVSVRMGCKLPKYEAMNFTTKRNKKGHWKYVCVEEPFNRTNTAFAVFKKDSFERILVAFKVTYLKLRNNIHK